MANKRLSVDKMAEKYPNQQLFIVESEICERTSQLISGIVQVHSSSRDDIHKESKEYVGGAAIRSTGDNTTTKDMHSLISYSLKNNR